MGKSIESLSDKERIAYCRSLAAEALANAHDAATDEFRLSYLDIAQSWTRVADEVERWTSSARNVAYRRGRNESDGDGDRN